MAIGMAARVSIRSSAIGECLKQLPSVERVVVLPYLADKPDLSALSKAVTPG